MVEGGQAGGGSATNDAVGESQVVRERRIERERGKGEVAKGREGRRWQCNK